MILDPVSFDQLARDHNIENVDEWKNLYESKEFDELQTLLNSLNKDLVTAWIQERQPDFIVQENEDVFDVLRRVDVSFEGLSNIGLYCVQDSLYAGFNFRHRFSSNPVYKADWLPYLSCLKRYELLSVLLERWGYQQFRDSVYGSLIGKFLNDACLDDSDNSLNNLLDSLVSKRLIYGSAAGVVTYNPEFAVTNGYIRNYIHWLCVIKQTDENSEWLYACHLSIEKLFACNRPDKLNVLLNEIIEQQLLLVEELAKFITSRESSVSVFGVFESLFETCMIFGNKEMCSAMLGLLKKEDVPKLLKQGRGRWLLTYLAYVGRQELIETVVPQCELELTKDEKDEFHSQLVKGSLSQNMILLLLTKELVSCYIIPEGTHKARKQALVYYTLKGRESLGEEEAQDLITELVSLDFEVRTRQDWEADTLERDMKNDIQRVKDNCSVLVVFMMAHGFDEGIYDATNKKAVKYTYVDDIINCTASGIPEGIPKICIIDACRELRPALGAWEKLKNIAVSEKKVKGPFNVHNYCRILAAAKGEKTWRNVMLPILMEEWKQGWKQGGEFYDIIDKVNWRMLKHEDKVCRGILLNKHEELMPLRPLYM